MSGRTAKPGGEHSSGGLKKQSTLALDGVLGWERKEALSCGESAHSKLRADRYCPADPGTHLYWGSTIRASRVVSRRASCRPREAVVGDIGPVSRPRSLSKKRNYPKCAAVTIQAPDASAGDFHRVISVEFVPISCVYRRCRASRAYISACVPSAQNASQSWPTTNQLWFTLWKRKIALLSVTYMRRKLRVKSMSKLRY